MRIEFVIVPSSHAFFLTVSSWEPDYLSSPIEKITKLIHLPM